MAALLAALILVSCEEGAAGIFSYVADAESTSDNSTKALESSSPTFVARLGTTYYAGIGTLWKKADGDSSWTQADTSDVTSKTLIPSAGVVIPITGTDTLFVAFTEAVSRDDIGVRWTNDGATWAQVTGLPPGERIKAVLAANNIVFVVTGNVRSDTEADAEYSIYSSATTAFTPTAIIDNIEIGVPTSVAWNGANYIFTAGGKLIRGADAGSLTVVASGPADWASIDDTPTYGGVCTDGTNFFVSGRYGKLYYSADNGISWLSSTSAYTDSSGDAYSLSAPTYIDYVTKQVLVVGTNSKYRSSSDSPSVDGYLEFDISGGFTATMAEDDTHELISSATNFESSLAGASINGMPYFSAEGKIFAMTAGDGLWSNTYDTAWGGWQQE